MLAYQQCVRVSKPPINCKPLKWFRALGKIAPHVKVPNPHPYPLSAGGVSTWVAVDPLCGVVTKVTKPVPPFRTLWVVSDYLLTAINWVVVGQSCWVSWEAGITKWASRARGAGRPDEPLLPELLGGPGGLEEPGRPGGPGGPPFPFLPGIPANIGQVWMTPSAIQTEAVSVKRTADTAVWDPMATVCGHCSRTVHLHTCWCIYI